MLFCYYHTTILLWSMFPAIGTAILLFSSYYCIVYCYFATTAYIRAILLLLLFCYSLPTTSCIVYCYFATTACIRAILLLLLFSYSVPTTAYMLFCYYCYFAILFLPLHTCYFATIAILLFCSYHFIHAILLVLLFCYSVPTTAYILNDHVESYMSTDHKRKI